MSDGMSASKRSAVFARSDVRSAADDFIDAIAEHSGHIWHPEDRDDLAESLTNAAFVVLRTPESEFHAR